MEDRREFPRINKLVFPRFVSKIKTVLSDNNLSAVKHGETIPKSASNAARIFMGRKVMMFVVDHGCAARHTYLVPGITSKYGSFYAKQSPCTTLENLIMVLRLQTARSDGISRCCAAGSIVAFLNGDPLSSKNPIIDFAMWKILWLYAQTINWLLRHKSVVASTKSSGNVIWVLNAMDPIRRYSRSHGV